MAEILNQPAPSPARAQDGSDKPDPSRAQILVVEDDLDTRELLCDLLMNEGFRVDSARDGNEVFEYLSLRPIPQLILLDLTLPKRTGAEVLAALNSRADRKGTRIIVASGWHDLREKAESMGADGFVRKPFDIDAIRPYLEILLGEFKGDENRGFPIPR